MWFCLSGQSFLSLMAVDKNGQTAPTQAQNPQQTGEAMAAVLQAALRKCHPPAALILGCRSSSSELWEGALIPAVFWRGRGMEQRHGLGPPGPCGTPSPSCAARLMHLGCRRPLYKAKTPSPAGSSPGSLSWGSGQGAGQSHHPRAWSLPSQWAPAWQLPRPPSQMLKRLSPAPCLISGAR